MLKIDIGTNSKNFHFSLYVTRIFLTPGQKYGKHTQLTFTYSKSTMVTLEKSVNYVQS